MRLAVFKSANKKKKEAQLPKLFGESQSLLRRMLFEKREDSVMEARGRGEKAA